MKEKFHFYYEEPDFDKLWKECTFVFDTNILLNLYRYPKETSEDLIKKLENDILNRLWMPYQIALEYQEGRYNVIIDQKRLYKNLKGKIKSAKNVFNQKIDSEGFFKQDHYYLNPNKLSNEIKKEINDICDKFTKIINEEKDKSHDFLSDDIIRNKLDDLFNGDKLGDKYPLEKLLEIIEEGKIRYSMKIPPGYGDNNKPIPEKFGDLFIWYQIIEYAKKHEKSIIFVTDDKTKEDWLINHEGESVPKNSLIQEFYDKTNGQTIYIYNFKQFMDESEEYLKIKYEQKTKEDIEKFERDFIEDDITLEAITFMDLEGPVTVKISAIFRIYGKLKNIYNIISWLRYSFKESDFSHKIIDLDDSEGVFEIILYYPRYKWPVNESQQLEIVKKFTDSVIKYYKQETSKHILI